MAMAHDLEKIQNVMKEYEELEQQLEDGVTSKTIETKANIKKLMTAPDVLEALSNLEVNGEPTWGLSCDERDLITMAREKVNEC